MRRIAALLGVLATTLFGASSTHGTPASGGPPVKIEMWLRQPGPAATSKGAVSTIDMRGLNFDEVDTYDLHYERMVKVRGMYLRDLISVYKPIPDTVDVILLHTLDGMVVPVSIERLRKDVHVFIALEIYINGAWTSNFPRSVRVRSDEPTEITNTFTGNKVVVGKDWRATATGFTPWRQIDTLTGIEFVESAAYNDQFRSKERPQAGVRGWMTYLGRCQFCHGIKGVGAERGPALTNVVEAFGSDGWAKVFDQVQAPGAYGKLRHFMPRQRDFTKAEAKDLVTWLDAMRAGTVSPYEPDYGH